MIKLMKSEFKKLFKSRINTILLIVVFLICGYQCFVNYNTTMLIDEKSDNIAPIFTLQDMEGNTIKDVDYYRLADKINHDYAGKINEETLQKKYDDFLRLYNPDTTIDTEFMKRLYGDNYKSKIAYAEEGKYTEAQFRVDFDYYIKQLGGFYAEQVPNSERIIVHPKSYTQADHTNLLYLNIYEAFPNNSPLVTYNADGTKNVNDKPFDSYNYDRLMTWIDAFDLTNEEIKEELQLSTAGIDNSLIPSFDATLDVFTQRYIHSEKKMDSRIGNTLFTSSINNIGFLSLLVLAIMLSNIFAMEKQYKTDQIMIPTAKGNHRITMAKLLCGYLTAFGTMLVQFTIIFAFSCIFVPMRSLSLVHFNQSGLSIGVKNFLFTYGELIGNSILLISIAALAISLLTMLLSYVIKNRVGTIIPMFAIIFFGIGTFLSTIIPSVPLDSFLPTQMMSPLHFFQHPDYFFPYTVIAGNIIAWKDIIMLFWILTILFTSFLLVRHSRRHIVTNH